MMNHTTRSLLISALLASYPIITTAEKSVPRLWEAGAELGWLLTGGNTDTNSLNAKLRYSRTVDTTVYSTRFETIKTEENDVETANKYLIEGGFKWSASDKNYLFATLLQEDDEFSQYDYQTTFAVGYGRSIMKSDKHQLDLTVGPGYRYSKFVTEIDGESDEQEGVLQVGAIYKASFSKTASFSQSFVIVAGEEQVISKSESSLTSQIANSLAMKASISFRRNSDPLPGDANTDRETGVTLVYTW